MRSNMGSMNTGSTSSKISSSSTISSSSSSSSSSSRTLSSNNFGSGMQSLPSMSMDMPGLTFKEMPSMPLSSSAFSQPQYTVSSPPPGETTHSVKASKGEAAAAVSDANDSVLLKFKEGSDFKLALNMQQFSPDDITIKLNGQDLTIEAQGSGEKFSQKHFIPYNVDLDAMTSSFSSDGVLVIRAPKKN